MSLSGPEFPLLHDVLVVDYDNDIVIEAYDDWDLGGDEPVVVAPHWCPGCQSTLHERP